ncbi:MULTISPECIES: XisI protein [unclassified Tolypothrix]|uniref:XisI protein n=1 Tax=unclassified Tolypothrix TaxID=2649714 RepID=UPI0005EAC469|nr:MULTISPECIES: XisI protein [unclassified Tolypothrix]BAY93532.1 XisI protein [Microchaete diplosiphon NIES-3275]EKE99395.1 heterocyst differentiation [Tolypothrix sp. PCC 7601]MBE9087464.1 XisI protein [Tolypothrix sp. LEGE 11397]UYD27367.1 XisI protein [Tolypothrix sp. PCC 7712]UYD36769.1 XisI protein [Tolypothrix sp. PCC 7601]
MEKIEQYRQSIEELLISHADSDSSDLDIESQLILDTKNAHYQLLELGWEGMKRIYNCVMHLDIKDGKIWIQRNMIDVDIAQELLEIGIKKEDIVLGLHPPYKRPYTGYGVA